MDLTDAIDVGARPSGTGCADCEINGGWWVHLRRCAACGNIGCCNSSPGQHATAHFDRTGHRLMRSFEPGEDWYWDFETDQVFDGPELAPPGSRPRTQGSPGPRERLPDNWRELVHP
ncbi:UBP-type zinc finger domain-containing protein [Oerskovia flava]|uniref:UBP-type zinc finger domain-containing protein n=1 Tax=Oerskovia flava TaxID=2986422 RepID=UPI002240CC6B|nr:UBP-type zinc finger domain-containing protein [Oerskovia sp. JB1-3-2]